jgi:hypothetical protein
VDDILESFVRSKRTLLTRVSSKLMYSEKMDDKIGDFVQELERSSTWMIGRREVSGKLKLFQHWNSSSSEANLSYQVAVWQPRVPRERPNWTFLETRNPQIDEKLPS